MKEYNIKVNGNNYNVIIENVGSDGTVQVKVNGKEQNVVIEGAQIPSAAISSPVAPSAPTATLPQTTSTTAPTAAPAAPAQAPSPAGGSDVTSPLPGVIIGINAKVGDKVKPGDAIVTLEAMKMENAIEAETAGTVTAIYVQKGDSVLEGAKIATVA